MERFRNKSIGIKPNNAFVNRRSAEEFAYPAKHLIVGSDEYNAKLRLATDLNSAMIVGSFKAHEEDDNRHKEAVGGWEVYETLFRLGDKWFRGDIKVMITSNGRLFYGISKIKNVTEGLSGSMTTSPDDTHTIAHPGGNVNEESPRLSVTLDSEARAQAQHEYDAQLAQINGTATSPLDGISVA